MSGRLGVGGSNPLAPTKLPLQNKGFADVVRDHWNHEKRTYRLRYVETGANSPEIIPKCVLWMSGEGSEVPDARAA